MIHVKIVKDDYERSVTLISKGHAEVAEAGHDPVCAAVSSHIFGLAKQISLIPTKRLNARTVSAGERDGDALIVVICKKESSYRRVLDHLAPAERAFELLEQHYPDAIRLEMLNAEC